MKPAEIGAFAGRVRDDARRYVQGILARDGELRALVAALEADKQQLEDKLAAGAAALEENEDLRAESGRLREQLAGAQDEIARHDTERARMQQSLHVLESESRRFAEGYAEIEDQIGALANLYVACCRLHTTLDREDVLLGVQEILANLLGCEEMAVFELDPGGTELLLVASSGIAREGYERVRLGEGHIGHAALTGERYVVGGAVEDDEPAEGYGDLTACIPLKMEDRVTGAIAMFRLLPQKPTLHAGDLELLDLLGTHAATALYCSAIHARRTAAEAARPTQSDSRPDLTRSA